MDFAFQWPAALALLALVPLGALAYAWAERRRAAAAASFGNPALVHALVGRGPGLRRHVPVALALVALALLALGMARPRASFSTGVETATVVLAIDVSGSMKATDVTPSRLAAARTAANAFIDRLPGKYRLGIVSFADNATTVLPPTTDRLAARKALANLRAKGGTALGEAIRRAVALVRPGAKQGVDPTPADGPPATIVLLSDGKQTAGRAAADAARIAADAGIPVNTVTLGAGPATVEIPLQGGLTERVQVDPDPATLRAIAESTKGEFQSAPDAAALKGVYERLGSKIAHHRTPHEITAAFAGAGALVLLLGAGLSLTWFRRVL